MNIVEKDNQKDEEDKSQMTDGDGRVRWLSESSHEISHFLCQGEVCDGEFCDREFCAARLSALKNWNDIFLKVNPDFFGFFFVALNATTNAFRK